MSIIVKAGKAGKKVLKRFLPEEKHHISYTRRIERVRTTKRLVAMTFDDGPAGGAGQVQRPGFDGCSVGYIKGV